MALGATSWSAARLSEAESMILPDGRRLGFAEYGAPDGRPVFGFHGTPGSRLMFRLVHEPARRLGLRIIAPDRPGFGLSSQQPNRKLADWAFDVRALADHLGIGRYSVAGISGGGPYAVACASLSPERVSLAALISPMGPISPPQGRHRMGLAEFATFRLMARSGPAMRAAFSVGRRMFSKAPDSMYLLIMKRAAPPDRPILARPEIRKNLLEGVIEGFRPGIRGLMQEMALFARPWELPVETTKVKVLLWQGTADRNVPVAAAVRLARLIPGCELFLVEGAGHYWVFDNVESVLAAMVQRLSLQSAG